MRDHVGVCRSELGPRATSDQLDVEIVQLLAAWHLAVPGQRNASSAAFHNPGWDTESGGQTIQGPDY